MNLGFYIIKDRHSQVAVRMKNLAFLLFFIEPGFSFNVGYSVGTRKQFVLMADKQNFTHTHKSFTRALAWEFIYAETK